MSSAGCRSRRRSDACGSRAPRPSLRSRSGSTSRPRPAPPRQVPQARRGRGGGEGVTSLRPLLPPSLVQASKRGGWARPWPTSTPLRWRGPAHGVHRTGGCPGSGVKEPECLWEETGGVMVSPGGFRAGRRAKGDLDTSRKPGGPAGVVQRGHGRAWLLAWESAEGGAAGQNLPCAAWEDRRQAPPARKEHPPRASPPTCGQDGGPPRRMPE